jgi:predicted O-methyltransferase YrrM
MTETLDCPRRVTGLKGFLHSEEGERLAYLASQVPADQAIVEIGSYTGKSSCFLAYGAERGNGVTVHCVDLWDLGSQPNAHKYATATVLETFTARTAKLNVCPHKASSADAAAAWTGPAVGLLFIDGMHTYEGVMADIGAWLPHMAPDGLVTFHDYGDQFPGVIKAVDEWAGDREIRVYDRIAEVGL